MTRDVDGPTGGDGIVRVAYLTQYFPPEPTPLQLWIARALRQQGLDIHVITGIPHYPSGSVHPGYRAWSGGRDVVEGLPVTRSPLFPSHNDSAAARTITYVSYALSATAAGRRVLRSADVALVYGSPVTAALAPMALRVPYVILVQDLWPDSVWATGFLADGSIRWALEQTIGRFSLRAYRDAAHVCVISPGMRDLLIGRGVPAERISVVFNWVDESMMHPAEADDSFRAELGVSPDDLLVLYAGTMGPAQDLGTVLAAMSLLRDRPDIHLALVGGGLERPTLEQSAMNQALDRVHFVDPVPPERMPALIAAADLNLVSLADQPLFRVTMPSKVQSILACGGAVLTTAPGDVASLVRDSGAGITVPPGDAGALAETLRSTAERPRGELRDMGAAGREFYLSTMSERINANALATVLTRIARGERHGPRG